MKFITIQKQELAKTTITLTSRAFYDVESGDIVETVDIAAAQQLLRTPPAKLIIKTKRYLTEILLQTITPAYLRGAEVVINGIAFQSKLPNPQYNYEWTTRIPSQLPQHLKQAYYNYQLKGKLYDELVSWNQERIQKAIHASKFKWFIAEAFYKDVFKAFYNNLKVYSPNKKTFFEAMAEINFECEVKPSKPLTDNEQRCIDIMYMNKYARAFGLQNTEVQFSFKHRTTPHGTTEEITTVSSGDMDNARTSASFLRHTKTQREGYTDEDGFVVKTWLSTNLHTCNSTHKQRENIITINYFLSLPKETQTEFLLPGWHFCPVCDKLYHETEGCAERDFEGVEQEHVAPITFTEYIDNHDNDDEYEF